MEAHIAALEARVAAHAVEIGSLKANEEAAMSARLEVLKGSTRDRQP
jgi:hypothetical protein